MMMLFLISLKIEPFDFTDKSAGLSEQGQLTNENNPGYLFPQPVWRALQNEMVLQISFSQSKDRQTKNI